MEKRPLLQLLIILLGFSCVLAIGAIPLSRGPMSEKLAASSVEMLGKVKVIKQMDGGETLEMEDELVHERKDIEQTNDYSGSGANPRHDPKTPGRS